MLQRDKGETRTLLLQVSHIAQATGGSLQLDNKVKIAEDITYAIKYGGIELVPDQPFHLY